MKCNSVFKALLATSAFTICATFSASLLQAETIRFSFDTESFFNRTAVASSFTHNSNGSGNAFGVTGLNGSVRGTVDVNRSDTGADTLVDYSLQVVMPHGIAPGFNFAPWTVQYSSTTVMTPGAGATADLRVNGDGGIYLQQEFLFDPFYGPAVQGHTFYDPSVRQQYPFRVDLLLSAVAGAGPDGGRSYAVDRVDVRCAVPGDARFTCNAFGQLSDSNYSDWSSNEGLASSFAILPEGPGDDQQDPISGVPLPAGLPLLLTGFAGLALARRRRS